MHTVSKVDSSFTTEEWLPSDERERVLPTTVLHVLFDHFHFENGHEFGERFQMDDVNDATAEVVVE